MFLDIVLYFTLFVIVIYDDGKRLKRLEVSREVIRGGCGGGGGADLQVLGLQNGVEEVQKTL